MAIISSRSSAVSLLLTISTSSKRNRRSIDSPSTHHRHIIDALSTHFRRTFDACTIPRKPSLLAPHPQAKFDVPPLDWGLHTRVQFTSARSFQWCASGPSRDVCDGQF
jgi:hypothetical protein